MSFQISALDYAPFAGLFTLPDAALAARGAKRVIAAEKPGVPCRVSLADAEIGEEVMLLHYEHQSADSPFRASHAIYVRRDAGTARPAVGEVPAMLRSRMLSLRAFDETGMLVAGDLAPGSALEAALEAMLRRPEAAYVHLHFAAPGCFAARVDRV